MRTFDRATFLAARAAWADGEYGPEWQPYRRQAADRGYLYPPAGDRHDERDAAEPSQRAIVYAAIVDTPRALLAIIGRSHSWTQVVAQLIQHQAGLVETAGLVEEDMRWERREEPDRYRAAESLADIMRRAAAGGTP